MELELRADYCRRVHQAKSSLLPRKWEPTLAMSVHYLLLVLSTLISSMMMHLGFNSSCLVFILAAPNVACTFMQEQHVQMLPLLDLTPGIHWPLVRWTLGHLSMDRFMTLIVMVMQNDISIWTLGMISPKLISMLSSFMIKMVHVSVAVLCTPFDILLHHMWAVSQVLVEIKMIPCTNSSDNTTC